MATYFRILDPGRQFLDANGDPANGYQLFVYTAGTTTKGTTYKDNAGATAHTNPIVLESDGTIPGEELWVLTGTYKLVLATAADTDPPASGTTLSDNIVPINDTGSTTVSEWVASGTTVTQASSTTFTVVGDQRTLFHVGRRLQLTDTTTLYGEITATAFGSPNTTVTVKLDSGTLSTSLSACAYSITSAINTSAPQGNFVKITSGTVANDASLFFTDLTNAYRTYRLVFDDCSPAVNNVSLLLRFSDDNGATAEAGASDYAYAAAAPVESGSVNGAGSSGTTSIVVANGLGDQAAETLAGEITIAGHADSSAYCQARFFVGAQTHTPQFVSWIGGGQYQTAVAIDAFQLIYSSGNISTMNYTLYGEIA